MKNEANKKNVLIRTMRLEDLDGVMEIETLSFQTPWSRNSFETEIKENNLAHYFVGVDEGKIVAYGGMWFVIDEGHITNVAVHPDVRGNGMGEKLVRFMIKSASNHDIQKLTLEVRTTNEPAIKLYEKIGFVGHGVRKGYYQDSGDDALIMWIEI